MDVTPSAAGPVVRLIEEFHKLPGIGPKSAQRLTYYLLRAPEEEARALAEAILEVKEKITFCSVCQNVTDRDPCLICANEERDSSLICVVEEPLDILALERTRSYNGLYHVLHGVISPMDGVGPEDLKVEALLERLKGGSVQEVILATNPDVTGDGTALHVGSALAGTGVKITRLARGLPAGGQIEYASKSILAEAISQRRQV